MIPAFLSLLLSAGTSALAQAPASAPAKPIKGSPEEVVCKREAVTGSLVQSRKTCMTRAQWQAQAEATQAAANRQEEAGRINSEAPR